MATCPKCGATLPDNAAVCPECGEIVHKMVYDEDEDDEEIRDVPENFSMPYLHAPAEETGTRGGTTDPQLERAEEVTRKTKKRYRVTAIVVAAVLVLLIALYAIFLGGYKLAAFRYIEGAHMSSGTLYLQLVPDDYITYLSEEYEVTKRDLKQMIADYWVYWNEENDGEGFLTYSIKSAYDMDADSLTSLEEEIADDYGIDVDISAAKDVHFKVTIDGETYSEEGTFVKIGAKWCCIEAFETIAYICYYDGYDVW